MTHAHWKDIRISNVTATGSGDAVCSWACRKMPIENLTLEK